MIRKSTFLAIAAVAALGSLAGAIIEGGAIGWSHPWVLAGFTAFAVLAVLFYRVINLWLPLIPALAGLRSVRRRHLRRGSARRRATV